MSNSTDGGRLLKSVPFQTPRKNRFPMISPTFGTVYSPPLQGDVDEKAVLVQHIVQSMSKPKLPISIVPNPENDQQRVVRFGPQNTPPTEKEKRALTRFITRFMDEYQSPLPGNAKHKTDDLIKALFVIG
jgi:hypothetical protein